MEHTEIGPYGSRWVASSSVANRGAVFWTYVIGPPLVVVAVVIAAAGITLDVISELGQGSRFWFELEPGAA
jgi:hypothetical protein